jgi:PKD repeat protein
MKRQVIYFLFLIITGIILYIPANCQVSQGGVPMSFTFSLPDKSTVVKISGPLQSQIQKDIEETEKNGTYYKYGRLIPVNLSLDNSGTWEKLPDGSRVWRIKLHSDGALALSVYFGNFYLPAGGRLFLYNHDKKQVIGAFTEINNNHTMSFATELIEGELVTIEYDEYPGATGDVSFTINNLGYAYRSVFFVKDVKEFGGSDNCEVNVNCSPEGDNWQDQKRGSVRISLVENGNMGWCSGSLINNTDEDCTPYVLSADHCGGSAGPSDFPQWVFYFNYEAPSCSNPASEGILATHTVSGCELVAHGGNGGSNGSDFLLVLLSEPIPDNYEPYFCGWNREDVGATSGVGIHHPSGDIKKISTYDAELTTIDWNGSGLDSHWKVVWIATTNGHGVTEPGSSGSPIFDSDGFIVGTLTGGGSYCSSPQEPDMYGKVSYGWTSNGTSNGEQLKPWLDPGNSGVMTLPGKNACANGGLFANFSASPMVVVTGGTVDFTDLSSGNPNSWSWTFEGGTPGTSNLQSPLGIQYNTAGTFNATLVVSNGLATDDKVKVINVVAPGPPNADFVSSGQTVMTGNYVNFYDLTSGGPTQWSWTFVGGSPGYSTLQNPVGITYNNPGVYNVSLSVSNPYGNDFVTKVDYITVQDEPPVINYCDTLNNMLEFDSLMALPIPPWGYIPGHNSYYINEYADLFENTLYDNVSGLIIPVNLSSSNVADAKVRFKVWDGDTIPGGALGSKDVMISDLHPNYYKVVMFDQPVPITGNFFVGYQITYYPSDNYQSENNFAVNIAKNRGTGASSTFFLKYNGEWRKTSEIDFLDSLYTSLSIEPITCYTAGVNAITDEIIIFPNPSGGLIEINLGKRSISECKLAVYDMIGNCLNVPLHNVAGNQAELDFSNYSGGIYSVKIYIGSSVITRKVIVVK